jgi:EmrB/QacA subfamily drug resistance transporter
MTAPASPRQRATAHRPPRSDAGRGRWLGMVVLSLGVSLIIVDATIVNVLLPQMVGDLGLRTTDAEWITSIYSLVFAALLISFGRAGDLFGRRRMFVLGTVVFVLASLLASRAGNGPELITARAAQGVGASMILPATLSTVNTLFTGRDRAIAFGIWGSMIGGMAALGPLLGGWLATSYGWRWAFGVNLPIGVLLVVGTLKLIPETRDEGTRRGIDWPGAALSSLGLGSLVFALIEGQRYGWWTPTRPLRAGPYGWPLTELSPVPVALALSAVLVITLIMVERARAHAGLPVVLDLSLFRIASFRRGNAASALISVGELGLLFVLPLFLQGVHGNSPLQICAAIVPLACGTFLAGPFAARLSHRYGAPRVVHLGMLLEVTAVLAIGLTTHVDTTGLGLAPWMLLYGVGLGLTSAQLTNLSLGDVPPARSGQASGTQSTARQIGSALGIALIGTIFATSLGHVMHQRLELTDVPPAQRIAMTGLLRESAGTYTQALHEQPGAGQAARAADESLAIATDRAVLVTAGILGLGLLLSLRLGPGTGRRPEESST